MRPPCEVATKKVIPTVRAILVRELVERHRMSQVEVAKKLGITQPAVSQYLSMVRGAGHSIKSKSLLIKEVQKFADEIAQGKLDNDQLVKKYCSICARWGKRQDLARKVTCPC
jgi:predicted transcriptional regulator